MKEYLISKGAPNTIEARLMKVEEAYELGCGNGAWDCNNAPTFVKETSYWLGSAYDSGYVWFVGSDGNFSSLSSYDVSNFGVRPVIVI